MRPFLDRLEPGSRILDGGCGMGEWTACLAGQGFKVVGVDIRARTIERLIAWFPHLQFVRADLRDTHFEPRSFDAYFSWGTFEHFEAGLAGCVAEAHRILKPGGWLFVSVPYQNWRLILRESRLLERWDESFDRRAGYGTPQRFYQWRLTRPELRRKLELHGFKVHSTTPVDKLTGAGRMLQSDLPPLFVKGSRPYNAACKALALVTPAWFISHMILAVAERW